jgi:hypothetical protein
MNCKIHGEAVLVALRMWQDGETVEAIGDAIGCKSSGVYALSKRCKFPARKRSQCGRLVMAVADPTPLEINARALRIRLDHIRDKRKEVPCTM